MMVNRRFTHTKEVCEDTHINLRLRNIPNKDSPVWRRRLGRKVRTASQIEPRNDEKSYITTNKHFDDSANSAGAATDPKLLPTSNKRVQRLQEQIKQIFKT